MGLMFMSESEKYLNKMINLEKLIETKNFQIDEINSILYKIKTTNIQPDKVQSSGNNNYVIEKMIDEKIKYEKELDDNISNMIKLKRECSAMIDKIDNNIYKIILYKYYFNNETYDKIADYCGYSSRWIQELHSKALKEFDKIYNSSY